MSFPLVTNKEKRLSHPTAIALGSGGELYVANYCEIIAITPQGSNWVTNILAGSTNVGADDGVGTNASFANPKGVAVDSAGNVYVGDTGNAAIRTITPAGAVQTLAGAGVFSAGSANGTGIDARFDLPLGAAIGGQGNLYVADTANNIIRKITPAGAVSTLAGTAGKSGFADGVANNALFKSPYAVAADTFGNVYVADTENSCIRRITPVLSVSTIAGSPTNSGYVDGTNNNAQFSYPDGIAIDANSNLYVADGSGVIRKITPEGTNWVTSTLAGNVNDYYGADVDGVGTNAAFDGPFGIVADNSGNVYVADNYVGTIREITPYSLPMGTAYIGNGQVFSGGPDGSGSSPLVILGEYDENNAIPLPTSSVTLSTGIIKEVTFYGQNYNFTLYALSLVASNTNLNEQTFQVVASQTFSGTSLNPRLQTLPVTGFSVNAGDLIAFAGTGPST